MARRSQSEWEALFAVYAQSNLSLSEFARQHGIAPKYFSGKRQKWLEQMSASKPFIEVRSKPTVTIAATSENRAFRLTGRYGELMLPSDLSAQWLGQLLREIAA